MYANELNTLVLVSLLKQHMIKKIIVSPGTTNISFVLSVQNDPWFEVFSAIDERSAAFMACGLAEASSEPVVLSCTGATASRNYLPGLTEAFYKELPILAVTSSQNYLRNGTYNPQFLDRSRQFKDLVKYSFQANVITENNLPAYVTQINRAILELDHDKKGPVHINLEATYSGKYIDKLPLYRKISRLYLGDKMPVLNKRKIGVFIGSHKRFSQKEIEVIDAFCSSFNAITICDQTSNYRGKFRYLANLANQQSKVLSSKEFDLLIHIGSVSGGYIPLVSKETWRVCEDGEVRDLFLNLTKVFQMKEIDFFRYYVDKNRKKNTSDLLNKVKAERKELISKIDDLPFSNLWIASQIEHEIPKNSVIHFGILNSLRAWNIFETDDSISCYANTGGFGIDGCLSSFIGAAKADSTKDFFGIFGDLSFFYDINSLANELPENIHILLVNNGVGTEFKNYTHIAAQLGSKADNYIAAKGHNGFKSKTLVKDYANQCGLKYLYANNKNEFNKIKNEWLLEKKCILEVFTDELDESNALRIINNLEYDSCEKLKHKFKLLFNLIKRVIRRGNVKNS